MIRIVAVAGVVLALAACSPQDTRTSEATSVAGGGTQDSVKLAQCLREQGVPAQDPATADGKPVIPESVPGVQVDVAYENCREFAPNYGKPIPPPDPQQLDRLRRFAQCMRDQGVDWADPDPRTGRPAEAGEPGNPNRDPNQADPGGGADVAQAARVCDEKVPGTGISIDDTNGPKGSDPT